MKYLILIMLKLLFKQMRLVAGKVRLPQVRWRPSLKGWRHWAGPCVAWIRLVSGKVSKGQIIQTAVFTVACCRLGRRSGLKGLTLYMKTCHVLLQQSLPGTTLSVSSRAVGKVAVGRCHDGLPRVIPRFARALIRKGHVDTIRLWLTLFGIYRVIEYIGNKSISSIVTRGPAMDPQVRKKFWKFLIHDWLPLLENLGWVPELERGGFGKPYHYSIAPKRYDPRASASADSYKLEITSTEGDVTSKYYTSFATRGCSAAKWLAGTWGGSLKAYAKITLGMVGTEALLSDMERSAAEAVIAKGNPRLSPTVGDSMGINGRLVGLPEPAGKVRIIALVDYWTQHMLLPLHDEIFRLLRRIPTDGTFDQLRPVKRLLKKVDDRTTIYSYDLKSATDRLSIKAQMMILSVMFSVRLAVAWKRLIVNRTYWLFCTPADVQGFQTIQKAPLGSSVRPAKAGSVGYYGLRYAQGQPMGAYSSWAMLALTHHAIVQWAAKMEGIVGWFDLYAVLGDDIIIAHDGVAKRYVKICEWFGVEIGLAKSLIAQGRTCEFAKKLFFNGRDCSGLPLKLWAASQTSMSVAAMLTSAYPEKASIANFVRALGVGFKGATGLDKTWDNMPGRLKVLMVYLTHPLSDNRFSFADLAEWLWAHGPNRRWSSTDDGMVNARPWLERVMAGDISQLRELVIRRKRHMVSAGVVRDPPVMDIHARAWEATVEFDIKLETFVGTLEDAWWKWKRRSLNRISEYAEHTLSLLQEAGGLLPFMQEHIFRDVKRTPYFSVSRLFRQWRATRKLVLAKPVEPKEAILRPDDTDTGDDW